MREGGNKVETEIFFDTIKVRPQLEIAEIRKRAHEAKINMRYFPDGSVSKQQSVDKDNLDSYSFTFE